MSILVTSWVWSQQVSPTRKLVLLALADHADDTGKCWPSLTRLQQFTGLSRSAVADTLTHLEKTGLISRQRSNGGTGRSTTYLLNSDETTDCLLNSNSPGDGLLIVRETDHLAANSPGGALLQSGRRTVNSPPGGPEPSREPSREPSSNHQKKNAQAQAQAQNVHPSFAQWYAHYPLKKSKGQALKAFAKIDPNESLLSEMIQALDRQKVAHNAKKDRGEWAPNWKYPATWLNGRCWEDEIEEDRVNDPDWIEDVGL